ncbi:hypothetical protein E1200_07310 [Actinomadura sp. GC306]|uniref:hypothetical protein n=1 Tax=Actinomadura sp. GC306 TaxID=2530367 RepID=UPI0010479307|nr:hypothetical protein [Actinomadura sp. GC306]TDC69818.1 hypothetical protein E1200_07310 [Actinomadura sp. GC306]
MVDSNLLRRWEVFARERIGAFALSQLVIGIGLLMAWCILFGLSVEEVSATRHAARGEGVPGTFTAHRTECGEGGCSWHGAFTTGGTFQLILGDVELRGDSGRAIAAGESVTALDVGSGNFVQLQGGPPEWKKPSDIAIFTTIVGGLGFGLNTMVVWGVYWTRASPAARRRQARERGHGRERWGRRARPGSSAVRVQVARSKRKSLAGVVQFLSLVALLLLFVPIWKVFNTEVTRAEVVAGLWAPVFALVLVGVAVQTLRLVLARPRMWVTGDEIVLRDPLLLWKVLRIPRVDIAAIHYGYEPRSGPVEGDVVQVTPFLEELNLVLQMRDHISLPARRLRWGNWFWVMLTLRDLKPQTAMPQRGRLVRRLCLRVKEPRRVAAELDRWLAEGEASPRPAPVDQAHDVPVRTYRGAGAKRIKLKGRLARPVLAEFVNEGPGTLRAWLRRTEFGQGIPVIGCGPEESSTTTVLDDRQISHKPLTRRLLHVEAEGRWSVTISGPERARGFTGSATGSGTEVLSHQGQPGIAVVTVTGGRPYQVHLRGPDLSALTGCVPVAVGSPPPGDESAPPPSTFALPERAMLQVRTSDADWRIDVTPLQQADADLAVPAGEREAVSVPPTGHVRPFEHSIEGHRTAVVRYLGPPGPVLFRSGDAFGLVQLDADLVPVRALARPDGDTKVRLRSHALLQVTGGQGTWSLVEAHPLYSPPHRG